MGTGLDGTTIPVGRDEPIMTRKNWGNSRWIAGELYEEIMLRYLPLSNNVFEMGSGWSTVVLSREMENRPHLYATSLEHQQMWYDKAILNAPMVDIYLALKTRRYFLTVLFRLTKVFTESLCVDRRGGERIEMRFL